MHGRRTETTECNILCIYAQARGFESRACPVLMYPSLVWHDNETEPERAITQLFYRMAPEVTGGQASRRHLCTAAVAMALTGYLPRSAQDIHNNRISGVVLHAWKHQNQIGPRPSSYNKVRCRPIEVGQL
jgi:hypothetical protein